MGITAAGGDPSAVRGADACANADSAADESLTIAYLGADLSGLTEIGIDTTVVEDPAVVVSAYINELNANGGINGRCITLEAHYWSLADPTASFTEACGVLGLSDAVFFFDFRLYNTGLHCATFGTAIPAMGLYTSTPDRDVSEAGYLLYSDDGSLEYLLSTMAGVAFQAGIVTSADLVGVLHGRGIRAGNFAASMENLRNANLDVVTTARVPTEFHNLELLLPEKQVRLLKTGLSQAERDEAGSYRDALSPEHAELFDQMEDFYREIAARFKDMGVTVVASASHWSDVHRMMWAAEAIDWTPVWLISDVQPATLVAPAAPDRQLRKLLQVSSRRAAGDDIPPHDRKCITMRDSFSAAPAFAHRYHTVAWNLITSICDYLDVAFSALTRIGSADDHLAFIEAVNTTSYEAPYGGLITFSAADRNGADRFRILEADPNCVLNSWGCMRGTTRWITPDEPYSSPEVHPDELNLG